MTDKIPKQGLAAAFSIVNIDPFKNLSSGKDELSVEFEILDSEENVIETRKLGFDITATDKEIEKAVAAAVAAYKKDQELATQQEAQDAQDRHVAALRQKLVAPAENGG